MFLKFSFVHRFICVCVHACAQVYACAALAYRGQQRPEEDSGVPGNWSHRWLSATLCRYWELHTGSLQEGQVCLTADQSLPMVPLMFVYDRKVP